MDFTLRFRIFKKLDKSYKRSVYKQAGAQRGDTPRYPLDGRRPMGRHPCQHLRVAFWNGQRATLTLRNPDTKPQELKTTLHSIFDIPQYIHGYITLTSSFPTNSLVLTDSKV